MRCALIFTWAVGLALGAAYDPPEVLRRATEKVLASAKEIPNYTCVENVSRDYLEPAAAALPRACSVLLEQRQHPTPDLVLRLYSTDRLRLDVTMTGKGEIYSWSGASRFDDATIDHLVRSGPFGTGSFGGFLAVVFETDVKKFNFERSITAGDRTLMEYSFRVAQSDSHYTMKADNSWLRVAYSGTFQVDAETADMVRMTITTGDLPPATGVCSSTTTMDLTRVRIGAGQFLLPRQTRQRFISPNAEETENTSHFTDCREFRGESTVKFSPDSEAAITEGGQSASAKTLSLPIDLTFSFELTASIPTDTAAAGDSFSAKLVSALRDTKGKLLAPKGAVVEGHLLRVQSFFRQPEVMVVLKPEALWIRSVRVPLSVERDWRRVMAEKGQKKGKKGLEILLPLRGEDHSGAFRFPGEHITVPSGFRSDWRTVLARDSVRHGR
jgi:hypothetical protein